MCLTNPIVKYNHIILAFITSKIPTDVLDTDYVIDSGHPDFVISGLRKSSTIKLEHLLTVRTDIIKRELGQLLNTTQMKIADILCKILKS